MVEIAKSFPKPRSYFGTKEVSDAYKNLAVYLFLGAVFVQKYIHGISPTPDSIVDTPTRSMRRMHKSDMCGVNKSLPYIAMVPLGCPQPTLSGMVPLCRCAQLFRPMFSRKSGVVKCISRNAVDAANILWLISGNPLIPLQPPTAQNTASPHRAHSRGARSTTPSTHHQHATRHRGHGASGL